MDGPNLNCPLLVCTFSPLLGVPDIMSLLFHLQALLLSIVLLSYLGNEGGRLFFGLEDFLGVGTSVGFTIIMPLVFITYLWDGNIIVFVSLLTSIQVAEAGYRYEPLGLVPHLGEAHRQILSLF